MRKPRKKRRTAAKRGRKPVVRTIQTAVRLPVDVIGHLNEAQAKTGRSRAKVIAEVVREHFGRAEPVPPEPSAFE